MDLMSDVLTPLMDFSFNKFITPKIVKILYGVGVLFAAILPITFIVAGFAASVPAGLLMLILSPFLFAVYVILARVGLEMAVVLFRIAEHAGQIPSQTQKQP